MDGKAFLINILTGLLMDEAKERQCLKQEHEQSLIILRQQISYFHTYDVSVSLHKDLLCSHLQVSYTG